MSANQPVFHELRKAKRRKPQPLRPVPRGAFVDLIVDFLEVLNTPRSLAVCILFKAACAGDREAACTLARKLPINASDYTNAHSFALDWQATQLLSKAKFLDTGIDLEAAAIESERLSETECASSNKRIRSYRSGALRFPALNDDILTVAQGLIAKVLNSVRTPTDPGWTPGRTTSAFGEGVDPISKYGATLDVTSPARKWALALLRDAHHWCQAALKAEGPCSVLPSALQIVEGNTMLVVPKNATTGRAICYEPHMLTRLQRAIGVALQQALQKFGVNLLDQSINQRRALRASQHGRDATLDLVSASSRVSTELVHLLLPIDWYNMLCELRCEYTTWPDGRTLRNEKFSAMGCGFTFELESLIFWALATAVCGHSVSVFGDDIIVPTEHYAKVCAVFADCGFEVNIKKSFAEGPFRESCGCDGWRGVDVTPFKVTDEPRTAARWALLHNQIRRWSQNHLPTLRVAALLQRMRDTVVMPYGPASVTDVSRTVELGHGHYHVDWDTATPQLDPRGLGWESYRYHQWTPLIVDRGEFHSSEGPAAISAGTGPKPVLHAYAASSKRTRWVYTAAWSPQWPSVLWT